MFSQVESSLASLRGKRFVFLPDPGNAGDSFIAHATYQLFDRLALDYEVGSTRETYPDRVVIWGGGGNLVPLYVDLNDFLLDNADVCARLIVLPHTIQGRESTLARLGANCEIFCRERMSFDHVRRHAPKATVILSHDLAFSADLDKTVAQAALFPLPLLSDVDLARRNVKRSLRALSYKTRARGSSRVLNCFRGDREKTNTAIPYPNIDASQVYAIDTMSERDSLETTYRLMRFVDGFRTVNTNRLHIAILAAMLGQRVNFYPNSYGKNLAVYEHSMAGRFENVRWCE